MEATSAAGVAPCEEPKMIATSAIEPMAKSAAREIVFDFIMHLRSPRMRVRDAHFMACDGAQSIEFANG